MRALLIIAAVLLPASAQFKTTVETRVMSFEGCLEVVRYVHSRMPDAGPVLSGPPGLQTATFHTGDRTVQITCNRHDRKMVTTRIVADNG